MTTFRPGSLLMLSVLEHSKNSGHLSTLPHVLNNEILRCRDFREF